jgi:hypothetical protein
MRSGIPGHTERAKEPRAAIESRGKRRVVHQKQHVGNHPGKPIKVKLDAGIQLGQGKPKIPQLLM